jgi:hypothetical protein
MTTRSQWVPLLLSLLAVLFSSSTEATEVERGFSIPMLDLDQATAVHRVVARDLDKPGQYLGHPTTVLLDDQKTLLVTFPTGHGRGEMRLMRSDDGGLTWAQMSSPGITLDEVPTLFKLQRPDGKTRLLITTCVPRDGTFQWTYSDDAGETWTPIASKDIGLKNGIIVALASLWSVQDATGQPTGVWRGAFHDFQFDNYTIDLTLVADQAAAGGYRCDWTMAKRIEYGSSAGLARARQAGLCEPGVIPSPDGKTIALLFRPQHKKTNAMISFSDDQGLTFSDPVELPGSLTGERHVGKYAPDGRLLICFRDYSPLNPGNPSHGDWVGWVGTWDDLMHGTPGQYRVRLKNNFGNSTNNGIGDCGYTGVELLPDATFVCVTYGHWDRNSQSPPDRGTAEERGRAPYILATRFRLEQLDAWVKDPARLMKQAAE